MLSVPSSFAVILFNMYLVIMTVNVTKKKTKLVTLASLATLCQAYFLANHAHLSRPGVFTSLGGDTVIAIIEWYVLAGLRRRDSVDARRIVRSCHILVTPVFPRGNAMYLLATPALTAWSDVSLAGAMC